MSTAIAINETAPDFDLSSTEGSLLSLRDEVPRKAVLLYFFADPESEQAKADLQVLEAERSRLDGLHVKILGVSATKMPLLQALQAELGLQFPLLRDDRQFSEAYGSVAASAEEAAVPALFLVDRQRRIAWMANPVVDVQSGILEAGKALKTMASPTENVPRSLVNRLLDRWLN